MDKKLTDLVNEAVKTNEFRKSKEFHDYVERQLKKAGFLVTREFPVDDRGDGRKGRIDLFASLGERTIAIELDHYTPRKKSIYKVQHCGADEWIILLRKDVTENKPTT